MNQILNDVTAEAKKWVKFVICPMLASGGAANSSLFTIYERIDREGSFKAVALFFHILWELGIESIATELASSVTDRDTVEVNELFSCVRPSERSRKKLRSLSLRLGLAKVFIDLETSGTEVENIKACLGDPYGERSFCETFTALETRKKISCDNCAMIEKALDSNDLLTYKEDLTTFFRETNPFLGETYIHTYVPHAYKYDGVNLL